MWIKAMDGSLVNADHLWAVCYNEGTNTTEAVFGPSTKFVPVAEGNVIPTIATAIQQGKNYVGVR